MKSNFFAPSRYFDPMHKAAIAPLQRSFIARTEWPTYLLALTIYAGWFALLVALHHKAIPVWLATVVFIILLVWYMSLQHELLHGHPSRYALLNKALGFAPLGVWYPYTLYRDLHLAHHRDEALTVPGIDPESNYVLQARWDTMHPVTKNLWHFKKTFVGRVLVGAPMAVVAVVWHTCTDLKKKRWHYVPMWLTHIAMVAVMLTFIQRYAGLSAWHYVFLVAWPALAVAMIRSFYEHRAAPDGEYRIAINDAGLVMRTLFLNNNYHLIHHELPTLAWYQIPAAYRMRQAAYRKKAGCFWLPGGYGSLLKRYGFRRTDSPIHPDPL